MKIEKINSSYRVRPMRNGKRYCFTFDHKPTKADIEAALHDAIEEEKHEAGIDITFEMASEKYIDSKRNVLSPSTIADYDKMTGRFPGWFLKKKIDDITQDDLNAFVNQLSLDKSAKTVRNYHGFVSAILSTYRPSFVINTHLPVKEKKEPYIPSDEDIKAILDDVQGKPYDLAIYLACYGLRRSEIVAITAADVEGEILHITKAKVMDTNKNWIVKNYGKTAASTRDIYIPEWLGAAIIDRGYVFQGHPNNIIKYLNDACKRLNIPKFSLHKMRHYFASKMHELGINDADIMALGGWETDHVMKTVYRHSLAKEQRKKNASDLLKNALF